MQMMHRGEVATRRRGDVANLAKTGEGLAEAKGRSVCFRNATASLCCASSGFGEPPKPTGGPPVPPILANLTNLTNAAALALRARGKPLGDLRSASVRSARLMGWIAGEGEWGLGSRIGEWWLHD